MLNVDDILSFRSVGNARISPDGLWTVFEVGSALAGPHSNPEGSWLWLVKRGGEPRQITFGPGRDSAPAWSPDGRTIAFLADRDGGKARPYLLPLAGGEARPLAAPAGEISQLVWSPDGRTLAVVRNDAEDRPEDKEAPIVVEEEPQFDRVWLIDVATGEYRKATDATAHTWELAWLPDSAGLALVLSAEPTDASWYSCWLATLDLATGTLTKRFQPAGRQVAHPAPSPDGRSIAVVSCCWSDPGMSGGDLWLVPLDGTAPRNETPELPFSINRATWRPDSASLICDAFDGTGTGIVRVDVGEGWQRLWHAPTTVGYDGLSVAADGQTFAAVRSDTRGPAEVYGGTVSGDGVRWQAATDLHTGGCDALTAEFTDVTWRGPDGLALGGILMLPPNATGPVPLVAIVHGGPTGALRQGFTPSGMAALAPLLAARGIACFLPNYRGSNGYGVAFAEAILGDMGGLEWADVVAGIDQLVATGVADPDRLGIGGWSYGGFLTMWAVSQTTRFKAAVAGAGIANWRSFHGVSSLHAWDTRFHRADPFALDGPYISRAPLTYVDRIATPTLILHGDADRDVPPGQSQEFFRALKDRGVETQLVLYPGSPHGPRKPRHARDILERSLAWFTTRLLPSG
jgi:dipeptidyl aminopeptidase/acylaminoacyl peptidase